MKGKDFEAFIRDDLCSQLSSRNSVVLDNLNSHKTIQVQELIRATGAKLLYLPRYAPEFNPIEKRLFANLSHFL